MDSSLAIFTTVTGTIIFLCLAVLFVHLKSGLKFGLALCLVLFTGSVGLYYIKGSPTLINPRAIISEQAAFDLQMAALGKEDVNTIVDMLYNHVQGRLPDNAQFAYVWRQLIALKIVREDFDHALALAEQALELFPNDVELLYLTVRTRQNASDGWIDDDSKRMLYRILTIRPKDIGARWLLALSAVQNGSFGKAESEFKALLADIEDPDERRSIQGRMESLLKGK